MSEEMFTYQAVPYAPTVDPKMTMPSPIWPDFNYESAASQKMIRAKRLNDGTFWSTMREVFAHDFNTLPMERYKAWASTLLVPIMSRDRVAEYIRTALNDAAHNPVVRNALNEPLIGMTLDDFNQHYRVFDDDNAMTMNRMIIYGHLKHMTAGYPSHEHTTQVQQYLKSVKSIVEIGAGAGEALDVICKLGFEGEYTIFDFKEMTDIQQWFHVKCGYRNAKYIHDVNELKPADLCIATWSLTEMPIADRAAVMQKLGDTRDWLIAYTDKIFGMENEQWIMNDFLPRFRDREAIIQPLWDNISKYVFLRHTP